jgi:Lipocalin-like domain
METEAFIGAWRLVSVELRDSVGAVTYPYGPDAVCMLIYSRDGSMSVAIMRAGRTRFAADDLLLGSKEEQAAAAAGYISYAGRYEVRAGIVVHRVEISLFPNWIGTEQVRFYAFAGDRLTLSTGPMQLQGRDRRGFLIWERHNPSHL